MLENRHTSAASELHRALIERCGPSRDGLLSWTLGANATRYAELAAVVIECANRGDAAAVQLARQAGAEIDLLAEALDPGRSVALALTGGLAQPLTPYLPNALQEWIQAPYDDAVAGALLLAQGRAPDERII